MTRRPRDRYAGVDWTRSDAAIARDLGVSTHSVWVARRKLGVAPLPAGGQLSDRYANVDWSKTNAEIARELGVKKHSVWAARKARGINPHPVGRPAKERK